MSYISIFLVGIMKYLFWNTKQNKLINQILCDLVDENDISIIVLAEYEADIEELIHLLHNRGIFMKPAITAGCERIKALTIERLRIEPMRQSDYATIQFLDGSILLCGIHLNSQRNPEHKEIRDDRIRRIVQDVMDCEKSQSTNNTVIVGDFNVPPYDNSCISSMCFYAQPIYEETIRRSRKVDKVDRFMFYNPMWNLLGDLNKPYGTYYYPGSNPINTYWHILDQVIIRPDLRNRFVNESLKILTTTSHRSLLDTKGHPDKSISDHLPLTFEIKESQYE